MAERGSPPPPVLPDVPIHGFTPESPVVALLLALTFDLGLAFGFGVVEAVANGLVAYRISRGVPFFVRLPVSAIWPGWYSRRRRAVLGYCLSDRDGSHGWLIRIGQRDLSGRG